MHYKMLEFIKKIFQNEEQEAKKLVEISLQDLEEWVEEKSKPLMDEVRRQTEEILMKVSEEVERTRFSVEILENAKLQNQNIPFKAKQYMEGNRKAYIRSVNSFLGHMDINNKDYFYLFEFCKQFDELINDLNKGTLRSYTILQEFFANETNKIAQNLRNFDKLFKELGAALNGEKMVAVNATKEKIKLLQGKARQRINLGVDFKTTEAAVKLANDEKNSIMVDIALFSKSEEHSNFINLNEERKNKERSFYEDQNQVLQSFSILERPLRKYSHIAFEHEEIVLEYLKEPVEALANDKQMKLVEVLQNLEKMLNDNQIQLDEKKKEKSVEEIKKLNKEFVGQFVKKYFSFKGEIHELENKITSTGVAEKLKDFNKKLEDVNFRIEKNNEDYGRLKNEIGKLDNSIGNLNDEIKDSIRKIFGEEIKVIA